jgi:plastocyanin
LKYLVSFFLLFPLLASAQSYKEIVVKNGGTISGTVRLKGAPRIVEIKVLQDNARCGNMKTSPALVLGKGNAVANAVISIEGITQGKKFAAAVPEIDQVNCEYVPHITTVPAGGKYLIVNSDPILHNVHSYDMAKTDAVGRPDTDFNVALPIAGMKREMSLSTAGMHLTLCDAGHPWMNGYVVVMSHPYYAVTDANGSFVLDNVPPGTYKIKMWHEGVPALVDGKIDFKSDKPYEVAKTVTVTAGGKATVDFDFTLR